MVIRKYGDTKGKRRFCLITSEQHLLRDPSEGTKEDQVDIISDQMKKHNIKLECIVFREPGVDHNAVMEENDRLLYRFRDRSVAKVVKVDSPTSLLGALKTRNVLPVTVFRGYLEVSSNFKIKVGPVRLSVICDVPSVTEVCTNSKLLLQFASFFEIIRFEMVVLACPYYSQSSLIWMPLLIGVGL